MTDTTAVAKSNGTRRKALREWLREEIDQQVSIDLPDLADRAVAHFMQDKAFMAGVAKDIIRPAVYEMGVQLLARTRDEATIMLGDEAVTETEFERRAQRVALRWTRWMEHTGTDYRQFMRLDSAALTAAADRRVKRADTEKKIARFERLLAKNLEGKEVVEDRYTAEELEEIWMNLNGTE